nr:hypothetical protein L203_00371 [Cryptococcus depauperatus CBS 7841]
MPHREVERSFGCFGFSLLRSSKCAGIDEAKSLIRNLINGHFAVSNHNSVANAVASPIVDRIKTFAPTQSHKFVLGLPTDGTLIPVYGELVRRCRARKVSFEARRVLAGTRLGADKIHKVIMLLWKGITLVFSQVDILPIQVHLLPGIPPLGSTTKSACAAYEALITSLGGIDLLLGPEITQAKKRFFDANEQVPSQAVSMGIGTILKAGEIMMLVNRELKSEGLRRALEDGVDHLCPASALQLHENASIFADEDAVSRLQTSTIKYLIAQTQESTIQKHTGELCNGACRKMGWKIITDFSSV